MFTIQYVSLCSRCTVSGLVYCLPENIAHNSEAQSTRQAGSRGGGGGGGGRFDVRGCGLSNSIPISWVIHKRGRGRLQFHYRTEVKVQTGLSRLKVVIGRG